MEFSRQEYWNGLPFPFPRDLPKPGIKPGSPALQADSLPCQIQKIIYCMILFIQHCRRGRSIRTETQLVHHRDPGKWEGRDHKRAWEILWVVEIFYICWLYNCTYLLKFKELYTYKKSEFLLYVKSIPIL